MRGRRNRSERRPSGRLLGARVVGERVGVEPATRRRPAEGERDREGPFTPFELFTGLRADDLLDRATGGEACVRRRVAGLRGTPPSGRANRTCSVGITRCPPAEPASMTAWISCNRSPSAIAGSNEASPVAMASASTRRFHASVAASSWAPSGVARPALKPATLRVDVHGGKRGGIDLGDRPDFGWQRGRRQSSIEQTIRPP